MNRLKLAFIATAALFTATAACAETTTFEDDVAGLTDSQMEKTVEFAFDNGLFFLFHEMGHMLISEFNLPVLGREEDAADTLSTLILLEMDDAVFDKALSDSVEGWKMSSEAGEDPDLWDTHSLDRQRAYHMVCMMIGKNAEKFKKVANDMEMPGDRREECADDYKKAHDSWFGLLEKHARKGGKEPRFTVNYQKPKDKNLSDYAELVKVSNILEVVQQVAAMYKLKDGIKLTASECGYANAYWSAGDREMTYCYELSQWYTQAMAGTFKQEEGKQEEGQQEEGDAGEIRDAGSPIEQ